MKLLRITLGARLAAMLCGIAALATALALLLHDRALTADLQAAAQSRLEQSAAAADQLLEAHLLALLERYRASSATPELRANLELNHPPTLLYYAQGLARHQHAAMLLFVDREDRVIAVSGSEELARAALDALGPRDPDEARALVVPSGGVPHAVASVPLATGSKQLGRLIAAEPIAAATISRWSALCGARVYFGAADATAGSDLVAVARSLRGLELRVESSLEAERRALAHARAELLTAGALALTLAFGASLLAARGLVRPIREIRDAIGPIGRGEFGVRLRIDRQDEIGDVARAFNLMADRVQRSLGELRQSEARLASAQRLARLASWSLDPGRPEIHASAELRRLLGLAAGESPIPITALLERIHPEQRERLAVALEECLGNGASFGRDHRTVEIDGAERVLHIQAKRVASEPGGFRVEGTVQDITERRLMEEEVRYLADHDNLTGLANRRLFKAHLDLSIGRARAADLVVGVIFLDLDGFKLINDTLGHSIGDDVLQEVSARLIKTVRTRDLVPRADLDEPPPIVARLGGDEFALVLPDISGPQDAGRVARRILHRLAGPLRIGGHDLAISASLGIATWPSDGEDVEVLLRNCETAMYHAKGQGRNNYQFFSEEMNAIVFRRLLMETRLRRALERGEIEFQYQPKVDLATGCVAGFEVLARWRDPELGIVSPTEFIPMAEETGLIDAIGEAALDTAVAQLRAWSDGGLANLRLSVNISAHQLQDQAFVRRVADVLQAAGVDPRRLDLEITETALMMEESDAIAAVRNLRHIGVSISLDDFGTGYSSLSYLRRLPIDTLKIDRSFVRGMESGSDEAALVGAIVAMARVLRLRVAVEGVETERQLEALHELGCDEVQGYLLSPPVLAADVPRTVAEIDDQRKVKRASRRGDVAGSPPDAGRRRRARS